MARMTSEAVLDVFRKSGALLEGHFVLRSGLHSRQFFQCALALQNMPQVELLGAALADRVRTLGAKTVMAPAMGGLVTAAEELRDRGTYAFWAGAAPGRAAAATAFRNDRER